MPAPVADKTQFTTLVAVSQALAGTLSLEGALRRVLALLERHHAMFPSIVTLPKGKAEELTIAAAHGLTPRGKQARYRLLEGITGRVTGAGEPIINHEPRFLSRAGGRKNLHQQGRTFICVPVVINRKAVGSLGVDLPFKGDRGDYDGELHFLQVVASMIAQAVNVPHLVEREKDRLRDENAHLRQQLRERYDFSNIIGHSSRMRQVYEQITQVATANASVLIRGESGTGKELIAHAIHYNSVRAKRLFVKVSCAAVPDTLIEADLFGHEKGAFSGTGAGRKGRFELADGDTLFLDEIGGLSLTTQAKLLRALQEREFERPGGNAAIKANVRLITATNATWRRPSPTGRFAATCTIGCTSSAFSCRRCASAATTCCCWPITFRKSMPASIASRSGVFRQRQSTCWPATTGRATCGSWRTPSSVPCWGAKGRSSTAITCRPRCRPPKRPAPCHACRSARRWTVSRRSC